MAYVVDLEESEFVDNDVPTTLIRSKADCPDSEVPLLKAVFKSLSQHVARKFYFVVGILKNI